MIDRLSPLFNVRSLIYFFSFVAGWPCVFYLMGWLPGYQINYIVLLTMAFLFVIARGEFALPTEFKNIIFIQIFGWILYSLIHYDTSYYTRILLLLITFLILTMQNNDSEPKRFSGIYVGWLSLQTVLGTIGILLVLGGHLHPIFTFREMDMRMGYYFGLFTTNTFFGGLVRNAGFYDEPGALAFWGMYALLINKVVFDNRRIEIILIVGLISTFSIAYFIQLALYLIIFYRKRTWKLVLTIALIWIALTIVTSYNESMEQALGGRFQYDSETGTISGDNRSILMERCWGIFLNNPIFGMGARQLASPETVSQYGFVGANFFFNWACDGLVGLLITYLPLIYMFKLGSFNKKFVGIACLLLVGFLQRPYDSTQLLYPLMTYSLLLWMYKNYNETEIEV